MADYQSCEPVCKGWSNDKKYRVLTGTGETCLLRVSDIECLAAKQKEYEIIRKFAGIGFPMSQPVSFGISEDGTKVHMLLTWVDGKDLETALPEMPAAQQYRLGREAGRILRQIHSLPLDRQDVPAETKKAKKLRQLTSYENSTVRIPGDETALRYVKENIDRIWQVPPAYLHGDYHPGNLILTPDGRIGVIDFNRWEVGDPYEEFYKLESFGREVSIPYCLGQIDAYFDDNIPLDFWQTLAVYVAHASLYSIKWAEKFGQDEIDGMVRRCKTALEDYAGFSEVVPRWAQERDRWL